MESNGYRERAYLEKLKNQGKGLSSEYTQVQRALESGSRSDYVPFDFDPLDRSYLNKNSSPSENSSRPLSEAESQGLGFLILLVGGFFFIKTYFFYILFGSLFLYSLLVIPFAAYRRPVIVTQYFTLSMALLVTLLGTDTKSPDLMGIDLMLPAQANPDTMEFSVFLFLVFCFAGPILMLCRLPIVHIIYWGYTRQGFHHAGFRKRIAPALLCLSPAVFAYAFLNVRGVDLSSIIQNSSGPYVAIFALSAICSSICLIRLRTKDSYARTTSDEIKNRAYCGFLVGSQTIPYEFD